jgi:DNA repair protein RecN (Recombination protein N)
MEILQYQFAEISEANIQPDEEDTLNARKAVLSSVGRLSKNTRETLSRLTGEDNSAASLIAAGVGLLREAGTADPYCGELSNQLADIQDLLADLIKDLSRYTETLRDDPRALEEIEERLDLLYRLKKKYGGAISDVLEHHERVKAELENLSNAEQDLKRLNTEKKKLASGMLAVSERISQKRKEHAARIQAEIESALKFLGMRHARFEARIERKNEFTSDGFDRVEFMISPNPGEPLKPLAKTASGGEMSRVMLAIKSVIADADSIETFIFDEIDTGVSGRTAQQVAEKLRVISKKQQILCITHLPQIAAMADSHYLIEKKSDDSRTRTYIHELTRDGQINELARLIGGARITGATLNAAEEMKVMAEGCYAYRLGGRK